MKRALLTLLVISACIDAPATGTTSAALVTSSSCVSAADFGAVPNDGIDDGAAIRAAFASGATHVYIGPGLWDLEYASFASVTLTQGQSLSGAGPSTVFRQHGDGRAATWYAFALYGGSLRSFAIYQDGWNLNVGGQTHMVGILAGNDSSISDLLMGPGSSGGGDCLRFLGTDATHQVVRPTVSHVVALGCYRSGVSVQHDVVSGSVSASSFSAQHGQAVDYEPTSTGPVNIAWTGNVITALPTAAGGTGLAISDNGDNRSSFVGNLIFGNVQAVRASSVTFAGNSIIGDPLASTATLQVIRDSNGLRITGNLVVRPAGAPAGFALQVTQNDGVAPSMIDVSGNRIVQGTAAQAIELEGTQGATVTGNLITMTAPWSAGFAISCRSVVAPCDRVLIANNVIEATGGTVGRAVELAGSPLATGRVLVSGNIATGFTVGAYCEGLFGGPVRLDGNIFGGVTCAGASVGVNL